MRILMKQLAAGARGVLLPGQQYDLPEAEALGLVAGNAAEIVASQDLPTMSVTIESEKATAPEPAGVEHATAPTGKRTKHRG